MSDGKGRTRAVSELAYPYLRRAAQRLVKENPADLIVSVHPLVNTTLMRAMRKSPRPYITVVTDLVSTHAFWFDRRADLVVVATEEAKAKAIEYGIPEGNLRVIGLPVADRFSQPSWPTATPGAQKHGLAHRPAGDPAGRRRGRHGPAEAGGEGHQRGPAERRPWW